MHASAASPTGWRNCERNVDEARRSRAARRIQDDSCHRDIRAHDIHEHEPQERGCNARPRSRVDAAPAAARRPEYSRRAPRPAPRISVPGGERRVQQRATSRAAATQSSGKGSQRLIAWTARRRRSRAARAGPARRRRVAHRRAGLDRQRGAQTEQQHDRARSRRRARAARSASGDAQNRRMPARPWRLWS